jgi:hypothetical protein
MLCYKCRFFWYMIPDYTSPYGEIACMMHAADLRYEDVQKCDQFEPREESLIIPRGEINE